MTKNSHSTELRTRDRSSALLLVDHYTQLFLDLRAALPPKQAEAVEAIMCGPFYDGPQSPRRRRQSRAPSSPPPNGLRTKAEAAAKLGCSIKTLNGHVEAGNLRYVPIGHGKKRLRRMYADADLDEFIANQTRKDTPCPSTPSRARHTSTSNSESVVIAFTAAPKPRPGVKPKK